VIFYLLVIEFIIIIEAALTIKCLSFSSLVEANPFNARLFERIGMKPAIIITRIAFTGIYLLIYWLCSFVEPWIFPLYSLLFIGIFTTAVINNAVLLHEKINHHNPLY
jgi:hypothetical protein